VPTGAAVSIHRAGEFVWVVVDGVELRSLDDNTIRVRVEPGATTVTFTVTAESVEFINHDKVHGAVGGRG